jgi:hypothetical protein
MQSTSDLRKKFIIKGRIPVEKTLGIHKWYPKEYNEQDKQLTIGDESHPLVWLKVNLTTLTVECGPLWNVEKRTNETKPQWHVQELDDDELDEASPIKKIIRIDCSNALEFWMEISTMSMLGQGN